MARWTPESFHSLGDLLAPDSFDFLREINQDPSDDDIGGGGPTHGGRPYEADFDFGSAPHGSFGAASALAFDPISTFGRAEAIDGPLTAKGGNTGDKPGNGGGKDDGSDGGGTGDSVLADYTSGGDAATSYNIEIIFKGTWTFELQQAFKATAEFLSSTIISDIQDVFFRGKIIDDIRIDAELKDIDGEGNVLGQAGPTAYRTSNYLPATAVMEFDAADAGALDTAGQWDEVVLHEMIHCLGFGTMWDLMGLITVIDGEYRFTGEEAIASYNSDFAAIADADNNSLLGVPVETDQGGSGTVGGHWDEATFTNELMTGFLDPASYLSDMSIAALDDMGYDTWLFPDDQIA